MWDKKDSSHVVLEEWIAIASDSMHPELLPLMSSIPVLTLLKPSAIRKGYAKIGLHDGMNMIIVTHEMGFACEVVDRIIFMADGEVLVDTTDVDDFFDNPAEPQLNNSQQNQPRK